MVCIVSLYEDWLMVLPPYVCLCHFCSHVMEIYWCALHYSVCTAYLF